jgi:hypothetical protein
VRRDPHSTARPVAVLLLIVGLLLAGITGLFAVELSTVPPAAGVDVNGP